MHRHTQLRATPTGTAMIVGPFAEATPHEDRIDKPGDVGRITRT